jgi:hypothetical protein
LILSAARSTLPYSVTRPCFTTTWIAYFPKGWTSMNRDLPKPRLRKETGEP